MVTRNKISGIGLLLLLCVFAPATWAGLADLNTRTNLGVVTAEVTFSQGYELLPQVFDGALDSFVIRLRRKAGKPTGGWHATQLDFDEQHHAVTKLWLEDTPGDTVRLHVQLAAKRHVELLPQYMDRHVLFSLTSPSVKRKLAIRSSVASGAPDERYAVTLESRKESMPTIQDIPRSLANDYLIYVVSHNAEDEVWQRLRVGFFASEAAANTARAQVLSYFPDAWVGKVSAAEEKYAQAYRLNPKAALERIDPDRVADAEPAVVVQTLTPSTIAAVTPSPDMAPATWRNEASTLDPLLEQADAALRAKDYPQAIKLYTKVTNGSDAQIQKIALERLGIARELNSQIAQAARVYRDYLARYPDTLGADRVQQRLDTLAALTVSAPAPLRAPKKRKDEWHSLATVSQFYRRYDLDVDGHKSVPVNGLFSDVNLNARRSSGGNYHEGQISASYLMDFADQLDGREIQVSKAAWESYTSRWRTGFKIGRQSNYDAGVLGRFDGLVLSHDLSDNLGLGIAAGYIVERSYDAPSTERAFQSVFVNYSALSGALRVSPFVMKQTYAGITDRQAAGFNAQYIGGSSHYVGLVDYDFHHQVLNNASFMANVGIGKDNTFSFSADQRRSPYISTRNALIGQPYEDLNELERILVDLSLEELANDRTALTRSLRVGFNRRLGQHWEMSTDFLTAKLSSTTSSMNVVGLEARQDSYFSLQLRALEVYGAQSYSGLSIRQAQSDASSSQSLMWDNRLKLGTRWMVRPRLRLDHREYELSDQSQVAIKPSVDFLFRMARKIRFELQIGYELTNRKQPAGDIDVSGLHVSFGYRATF